MYNIALDCHVLEAFHVYFWLLKNIIEDASTFWVQMIRGIDALVMCSH
jgi:hypothetical protein